MERNETRRDATHCRAVVKNLTLGEFGNKADESWEGERRLKVEFVNEKISPDKDCCWETTADKRILAV